jgi:heptose I phosphotransferase
MLKLADTLQKAWAGQDIYDVLAHLEGQVYREKEGRRTFRFERDGQSYFAKVYMGIGWKTLLACLLKFRKPIIGAENEWQAIQMLPGMGIETMRLAGYGKQGRHPVHRRSFIITEELRPTISLEDFCLNWKTQAPPPKLKRALIEQVAEIARALHANGMVHRDLYLCHFLLDTSGDIDAHPSTPPRLYLIDLHRVEQHRRMKQRWRIKDVAGLYFSSMDIGLTQRDLLRFIQAYHHRPWRIVLHEEGRFWKKVARRAQVGYREYQRKAPLFIGKPATARPKPNATEDVKRR